MHFVYSRRRKPKCCGAVYRPNEGLTKALRPNSCDKSSYGRRCCRWVMSRTRGLEKDDLNEAALLVPQPHVPHTDIRSCAADKKQHERGYRADPSAECNPDISTHIPHTFVWLCAEKKTCPHTSLFFGKHFGRVPSGRWLEGCLGRKPWKGALEGCLMVPSRRSLSRCQPLVGSAVAASAGRRRICSRQKKRD